MAAPEPTASPRRRELLEAAYAHALRGGLGDLSLRPLAEEIGSSPRVLLYLFGSKDGLIRALLARARSEELAAVRRIAEARPDARADVEGEAGEGTGGLEPVARELWRWLSEEAHRALLTLWVESYARSLVDPAGPWGGFARDTVDDWLAVLAAAQPAALRTSEDGLAQRTLVLGVLRGALLDLLATGDTARTTAAVHLHLARLV